MATWGCGRGGSGLLVPEMKCVGCRRGSSGLVGIAAVAGLVRLRLLSLGGYGSPVAMLGPVARVSAQVVVGGGVVK